MIMGKKLFDFCLGNPPYNQEFDSQEGNKTYAAPVYNDFIDAAIEVADKVELIHPARFLFNAGSTPKAWNEKMLADPHFKVLHYEEDAASVFSNTEIKGGVAITYRDSKKEFGAIVVFTKYEILNSILKKVISKKSFKGMSNMVVTRTAYRLTQKLHDDYPEAINQLSKGHAFDMSTNIFERLPQVFYENAPNDGKEYSKIIGREGNVRTTKYIRRDYINDVVNYEYYKLLLPKANGAGAFGETLSQPIIMEPKTGSTETFISIGSFTNKSEAESCLKYIKCKITRALLGILKTTQDITPDKWKYVPIQNFSDASDINWNTSIKNIDKQLYKKYGLSDEEINFVETNVKEME